MATRAPQDQDKYVVRFPDGMRDQLKEAASDHGRTLNAEIVTRIRASFEQGFSNDELLASIRELVLAKRITDLFGDEIAEGISAYAQEVSSADRWSEAVEELLRWALIDAGVLYASPGERRPVSPYNRTGTQAGAEDPNPAHSVPTRSGTAPKAGKSKK